MGAKHSKISPNSSASSNSDIGSINNGHDKQVESFPQVTIHQPTSPPVSSGKVKSNGPPLHLIPSPVKKSSPTSVTQGEDTTDYIPSSGKIKKHFAVGDQILGNFEGNGEWYPGTIIKAYEDGVYDIDYDDGDSEESVPASDIKLRPKGTLGPLVNHIDPDNSPPLAAVTNPPHSTTTKTHKISKIISVQSSSKLIPDSDDAVESAHTPTGFGINRTHSSSSKLSGSGKKHGDTKLPAKPPRDPKVTEEVEDYGAYDGSLDFVPRTCSKQNVKANMYDDDDDEFAELDDEEDQKCLLKSVLSGERSDASAVIKNLYREDSKSNLFSPQQHDDKRGGASGASVVGPSIVDIEK
jgi:hypothetical protein